MNIYRVTAGSVQQIIRADSTAAAIDAFTDLNGVPSRDCRAVIVG